MTITIDMVNNEWTAMMVGSPRLSRGAPEPGGLLRFAYDSPDDLRPLVPDAERDVPGFFAGVEPYPRALFWKDLLRVTEGRTDPELTEILTAGRRTRWSGWSARESPWSPRCPLFHTNYPGGTGLVSGAVSGRLAGAHAAGE